MPKTSNSDTQHQWDYLGFNYASWWNGKFAASESTQAFGQLEATGAESAAIVATHYLDNTQSSEIFATQSTESLQNVEKAITDAKSQGLSVWLKPHIDLQSGQWRGLLDPSDRTAFFNNYKALLLDYAELAQAQGVEVLVVGTEIDQLIGEADKDAWVEVINDVKQVYDGKLTYAANWDAADQVSFASELDFVGVDAYYPLTENKEASVEQLVEAWTSTPEVDVVRNLTGGKSIVDWLEQVSDGYGKPLVFTEIGFRSLDGNAARPYEFQGGGQVDLQEQARLYEAVFKVFGGEVPEAGNLDWFQGAQFWNWYATESQNGDPTDLDYPILGKPSEQVFKEYSSQLISDSPAPPPNPNPNPQPEDTIGEYGTLDLNHQWQTIALNDTYDNPVVIVSDPTFKGSDPANVRVRNVTGNTFQLRIQEPNYKDGSHTNESVSYMVVEAGDWKLADGTRLSAGTRDSNRLTSAGFEAVDLKGFQSTPTVLSQVQTANGGDWVTTRTTGQSATGFQVAMQEEEALNSGTHTQETLGWLVIDSGMANDGDTVLQGGTTGRNANHTGGQVQFDAAFDAAPSVIAKLGSYYGPDNASLRLDDISRNSFGVTVQEEQSFDNELYHVPEAVSFVALEGSSGVLTGVEL